MQQLPKFIKISEENGMALVLTLMAVSFLVAITVQLTTSVNWQMQGAGNLRDSVQLDAMNRSGLSLIRASLAADFKANKYDSEHDSWSKLDASSIFGQGNLKISVTDLAGLLQVNALVPDKNSQNNQKGKQNNQNLAKQQQKQIAIWKQLLTSGRFAVENDAEAEELIDSIIDWIDADDNVRNYGAESGYYLTLSPSYEPRNAPLVYLEELLLIRGMTKELFYGNEAKGYAPLSEYLTVAGRDGKININSVKREVLMAVDDNLSEQTFNDLEEFRQDENNQTSLANPSWYKQVNGGLNLDPDIIDVQSQYFEVSVVATHNELTRSGKGILERDKNKGGLKLLYWEVR